MFSNCPPWQFHGHFQALGSQTAGFKHIGGLGSKTADLGSFMAGFQPLSKVAMKLSSFAVYNHFLQPADLGCFPAPGKSGHETADLYPQQLRSGVDCLVFFFGAIF